MPSPKRKRPSAGQSLLLTAGLTLVLGLAYVNLPDRPASAWDQPAAGLVAADAAAGQQPAPASAARLAAHSIPREPTAWGPGKLGLTEASCSSRGCHGGTDPRPNARLAQNEHTVWMMHDRHARAYDVLRNPQSKAIAKALGYSTPAHEHTRCLACHSTPERRGPVGAATVTWSTAGVTCYACHGQPGTWEFAHVAWTAADTAARSQLYAASGMTWLRDPLSRGQSCVGCHVGAAADDSAPGWPVARDVNHDLIAAGHPRLDFDLPAYLEAMPKHWREREVMVTIPNLDLARFFAEDEDIRTAGEQRYSIESPTAPLRTWAGGVIAASHAWAQLTKDRAGDHSRPWPELAESSCFGCHHDLTPAGWPDLRITATAGSFPGQPAWGNLYADFLPLAYVVAGAGDLGATPRPEWTALRSAMNTFAADRAEVIEKTRPVFSSLQVDLAQPLGKADLLRFSRALRRRLAVTNGMVTLRWEEARHLCQAAVAWAESANHARALAAARDLQAVLAFPNEPAGAVNSPARLDPRRLEAALARLHEALPE